MAAEAVPAKQNLILLQVGKNVVRPVQEQGAQEAQGFAAQFDFVPFHNRLAIKWPPAHLFQEFQSRTAGHDSQMRHYFKQFLHRSRVVWFGMVDHQIFHLLQICHFTQGTEIFFKKGLLNGIDKGRSVLTLYQVGIIGGSGVGLHHDVEIAEIRILYSQPVHPFSYLNCHFHSSLSSLCHIYILYLDTWKSAKSRQKIEGRPPVLLAASADSHMPQGLKAR